MTHMHSPTEWLPLTLAQLDFWEEFRFHPDEAVSTVAHAIELSGPVDPAALASAVETTVAEAQVLTVRFREAPGDAAPRQSFDPARQPRLHHVDLSGHADPMAEARRLMQADLDQPLDLRRQPLSAQWLVRLGEAHWLWYNRGHHIILDGYSMGLLEQRCARLYGHFAHGDEAGTPLAPFTAYLAEEERYRASPAHKAAGRFWRERLVEAGDLPVIRKGEEDYAEEGLAQEFALPGDAGRLAALGQATGLGWADLMTTLCAAYLLQHLPGHRATGADGAPVLPVWLPYMSRMGSVSIAVPALVVNILPLNVAGGPATRLGDFIAATALGLRQLRRHGRYRIEQIAGDHGITSGSRFFFSPLINVLPFDEPRFPGCDTRRHVLSNGPGDGFNITIRANGDGSNASLRLDADPAMTPPAEFAAHGRDLARFLDRALAPGSQAQTLAALAEDD